MTRPAAERLAEIDAIAAELRTALARIEAERAAVAEVERKNAIIDAIQLFDGDITTRAKALETELSSYLGNAWRRERAIENLPANSTPKRRAMHRIARSRNGKCLKFRRIFDIVKNAIQRA